MITHPESWMDIRKFRALHQAGAVSHAEIAAEAGCDWRRVKKYLAQGAPAVPPVGSSRMGTQPRKIGPFTAVGDLWLRADVRLRAPVIWERLAPQYGYDGSYQRVKLYAAESRPKIAAELGPAMTARWPGCTADSRWSPTRRRRWTGATRTGCWSAPRSSTRST
jgi:hypothetical protein